MFCLGGSRGGDACQEGAVTGTGKVMPTHSLGALKCPLEDRCTGEDTPF